MLFLLCVGAGAYCYRRGGANWGGSRLWREVSVPICGLLGMISLFYWHWSLLPSFAILGLSLTTYNKWLDDMLGYPHADVYWPAWAITGLFYGLSMIPYAYYTGSWFPMAIRTIFLTIFIPLWSAIFKEVNLEEGGRGAGIIASLSIFSFLP